MNNIENESDFKSHNQIFSSVLEKNNINIEKFLSLIESYIRTYVFTSNSFNKKSKEEQILEIIMITCCLYNNALEYSKNGEKNEQQ